MGIEDNRHGNYGLRENPKKSWWVSSDCSERPSNVKQVGNFCKQCGREFKSPRALFGHMRSHSKKKVEFNNGVCVEEVAKISNPIRDKRSVRRYKIPTSSNKSSLSSLNATSSSVATNVDDHELEDVAVCLLMLAKGGFYSVDQVSDDESVKMESNFPIESSQVTRQYGVNLESSYNNDHDDDHVVEGVSIEERGPNSYDWGYGYVSLKDKISELHAFGCGISKIKGKNVEFGPNNDGLENPCVDTDEIKDKKGSMLNNLSPSTCSPEFEEVIPLINEHKWETTDQVESSHTLEQIPWNNKRKYEKSGFSDQLNSSHDSTVEGITLKQPKKYICSICNKSFRSHQSLGGHRLHCPSYRRFRPMETVETQFKTEVVGESHESMELEESNNSRNTGCSRKHICLVCCKAFPSGRALGGHMRAHFQKVDQTTSQQIKGDDRDLEISAVVEGDINDCHVSAIHDLHDSKPVITQHI